MHNRCSVIPYRKPELYHPSDRFGHFGRFDKGFHEVPENTLDVITYGSSHMWKGLDPRVINEKYGIAAYNYACNWQHINTTKLFIEDSLLTQHPKLAVIDTYMVNWLLRDTDLNGEIYYTRFLKNTPSRISFLRQCFGRNIEGYVSYFLPFVVFHENWKNISQSSYRAADASKDIFIGNKGFSGMQTVEPVTLPDSSEFGQEPLTDQARRELDAIVNMLQEQGARVLFITIPYEGEFKCIDAVTEYASEHDCDYLNLFEHIEEIGLDGNTDFCDAGHLNESGGGKIGDFMGAYLKDNYGEIL